MDPSLLDHHHRYLLGTVGSLMVRVLVGEDVGWADCWVVVAVVAVAALCWTGTLNTNLIKMRGWINLMNKKLGSSCNHSKGINKDVMKQ